VVGWHRILYVLPTRQFHAPAQRNVQEVTIWAEIANQAGRWLPALQKNLQAPSSKNVNNIPGNVVNQLPDYTVS
jgi:hypothetical protein